MKLIGIDLDGTLLNSQQVISQANVKSLIEISQNNLVFICSGREVGDIKEILKMNQLNIPSIGSNGAIGYDKELKLFEFHFIDSDITKVYTHISQFPTKIYTNLGSYESVNYKRSLVDIFEQIGEEFPKEELDYELEYEKTVKSTSFQKIEELIQQEALRAYKLFVFIPNSKLKREVKAKLAQIKGINVTESSDVNLEIIPGDVSKGLVFKHLERIYDLEGAKRFAIGDSLNDLSLFEHADYSFAMGNGHEQIKAIADYVTVSNDEDGVSQALKIIAEME